MSDRLRVTYRISGNDPRRVAEAIRVEQTIEFPFDLAPDWIQNEIVGQIDFFGESVTGPAEVAISIFIVERTAQLPANQYLRICCRNLQSGNSIDPCKRYERYRWSV